jgi:ectoine hydroxylase-related dioxygenase (phytanoyl-CoA dioxygenase family)
VRAPLRPVTEEEVVAFERDGVVCLRAVLPRAWISRMEGPLEQALRMKQTTADLTEMGRAIAAGGGSTLADPEVAPEGRGRFRSGVDHWRHLPEFRAFACESPLPELAAALLRSRQVNLYEDSVLVKEPGTAEPTAFHQDLGYFHVEGEQICTFWVPLDPVTAETGAVVYVRGSHRDGRVYKPNLFVSEQPIPGTRGEDVPEVRTRPGDFDLVSFEMQPGDVAVHHARTLHGAPGNRSATARRRAISVRYCGDDARYFLREGAPRKPHQHRVRSGDGLDSEDCPVVFRAPSEG